MYAIIQFNVSCLGKNSWITLLVVFISYHMCVSMNKVALENL